MARWEDEWRKEYPSLVGMPGAPVGRAAPVASSEYMTAGMWDDYIRPGIKWLGDVIPGIGRSDTSSRKTIDESKKLLKDMRDSDLYLRRSEKDAEEEARKELERYLREVEERDKTFKDASLDDAIKSSLELASAGEVTDAERAEAARLAASETFPDWLGDPHYYGTAAGMKDIAEAPGRGVPSRDVDWMKVLGTYRMLPSGYYGVPTADDLATFERAAARKALPTLDERLDVPDVSTYTGDTGEVVSPSFLDSIISPAAAGSMTPYRMPIEEERALLALEDKRLAEDVERRMRYDATLGKWGMSGGEFYEGSAGKSGDPDALIRAAKIAMGEPVMDLTPKGMEAVVAPLPKITDSEILARKFKEYPAATLELEHPFGPDATYTTISPEVRFGEDMYGKAPPTKYWGTTSDEFRFGADELMTTPITRVPPLEFEEDYYPGFSGSAPMPIVSPTGSHEMGYTYLPPVTPPTGSHELESYFPSIPHVKRGEGEVYALGRYAEPVPGYKYLPSGELVEATRTDIGDWEFVGDPSYSSPGIFDTVLGAARDFGSSIIDYGTDVIDIRAEEAKRAYDAITSIPGDIGGLLDFFYTKPMETAVGPPTGYRDASGGFREFLDPDPYRRKAPDPFPLRSHISGAYTIPSDPTWAESGPLGYSSITGTFYPTLSEIMAAEAAASEPLT